MIEQCDHDKWIELWIVAAKTGSITRNELRHALGLPKRDEDYFDMPTENDYVEEVKVEEEPQKEIKFREFL